MKPLKNILDEPALFQQKNEVPDSVLLEIGSASKNYPAYFIEVARQELAQRKVDLTAVPRINESLPPPFVQWIKANPLVLVLIILSALIGGIAGCLISLISVFIARFPARTTRRSYWKILSGILVILLILFLLSVWFFTQTQ